MKSGKNISWFQSGTRPFLWIKRALWSKETYTLIIKSLSVGCIKFSSIFLWKIITYIYTSIKMRKYAFPIIKHFHYWRFLPSCIFLSFPFFDKLLEGWPIYILLSIFHIFVDKNAGNKADWSIKQIYLSSVQSDEGEDKFISKGSGKVILDLLR